MTESQIASALATHHSGNEWAFLTQVRNSTGFQRAVRTADAVAISLWPSRGIYATGYEIKVSKADLKKELDSPEKAEEIARFCRYWFVATPKDLCKPEDLPPNWGLVTINEDGKPSWKKPAKENEHAIEPSWLFVASVLRNVGDSVVPKAAFDKRIEEERRKYEKSAKDSEGWELKRLRESHDKMVQRIAAFEEQSGIKLDRYSEHFNGSIGEAVKIIRDIQVIGYGDRLRSLQGQAAEIAANIGRVLDAAQSTVANAKEAA